MPPQQPDRLLGGFSERFDFGAHDGMSDEERMVGRELSDSDAALPRKFFSPFATRHSPEG
jgi:hypothetical protein